MLKLIDTYYENVYNATLLLHKESLLESLAVGSIRPHVVMSVCAWGANFHQDPSGRTALKDDGFMFEWAQRAGLLVFQDAEKLYEDNIVTFLNLALFWHSQGSWRVSLLHKGNAYQVLQIRGIGPETPGVDSSFEAEVRRRRFWACYLMYCHTGDDLSAFQSIANTQNLSLPWPEGDFHARVSRGQKTVLGHAQESTSIYAETVRIMTIWSSIVALIKSPEAELTSQRISRIYALDEELSVWWRTLKAEFKLNLEHKNPNPLKSDDTFPKLLLINVIYHQSLCALHASIVPLFCWTAGDDNWAKVRKLSAQTAFDHACAASVLINATLVSYKKLSTMSLFIAYAAYCGYAIQLPFLWCSNPMVREQVRTNLGANLRMIDVMTKYWRYAPLLKLYARCLYNVHKKYPSPLEDIPSAIDITRLIRIPFTSSAARVSILDFIGILWTTSDGYTEPGEEVVDLEIDPHNSGSGSQADETTDVSIQDPDSDDLAIQDSAPDVFTDPLLAMQLVRDNRSVAIEGQSEDLGRLPTNFASVSIPQDLISPATESRPLDILQPFLQSDLLDLFPTGDMIEFSLPELEHLGLNRTDG
ncbi:hypothetical protein NM208_g10445 [Fusarium decemcellulare]|uniref:Uncharacterized protein n=1 Tax=Fusarium decemcellulare TaxID=57161 RepID=A0ACC1RXV7_9HYPO|nr:hypothetical protein NM208_g10445 [Fusarium decemcellulare]